MLYAETRLLFSPSTSSDVCVISRSFQLMESYQEPKSKNSACQTFVEIGSYSYLCLLLYWIQRIVEINIRWRSCKFWHIFIFSGRINTPLLLILDRGVARSNNVGWTHGESTKRNTGSGAEPQRCPGAEPLVRGLGGFAPEAETF